MLHPKARDKHLHRKEVLELQGFSMDSLFFLSKQCKASCALLYPTVFWLELPKAERGKCHLLGNNCHQREVHCFREWKLITRKAIMCSVLSAQGQVCSNWLIVRWLMSWIELLTGYLGTGTHPVSDFHVKVPPDFSLLTVLSQSSVAKVFTNLFLNSVHWFSCQSQI